MLICVGLAVDYAAHIAHMFKDASERGQDSQVFSGRVSRMFFLVQHLYIWSFFYVRGTKSETVGYRISISFDYKPPSQEKKSPPGFFTVLGFQSWRSLLELPVNVPSMRSIATWIHLTNWECANPEHGSH